MGGAEVQSFHWHPMENIYTLRWGVQARPAVAALLVGV